MTAVPVSVLMPVYNAGRYVAEAVESILAQTLGDFELIVIDDGSTDDSGAILRRLAARDGRIRLVGRENRGICRTRNEALAMARGEFVAVMDADDVAAPRRLEAEADYLRGHPEAVAVGCAAEIIDSDGDLVGRWPMPPGHREIDEANLRGEQSVVHSSLMARRAAVVALGGYRAEAETSEDLDLLLRLAEVGRLANLGGALIRYRVHGASVTHSRRLRQAEASHFAVADALRRRGLPASSAPAEILGRTPHPPSGNHRRWAWGALRVGNLPAARKHALAALRRSPLHVESWRVAFCALRGH